MPQLLICGKQIETTKAASSGRLISECRPASNRNGGRDQIGVPGRIETDSLLPVSARGFGGFVDRLDHVDNRRRADSVQNPPDRERGFHGIMSTQSTRS
jgi:hypothetical protein